MRAFLTSIRLLCKVSTRFVPHHRLKTYKSSFTQEFAVSTFSNLKIDCNFNVAVQPLSVAQYVNQDRVIVNMLCHKPAEPPSVECAQNADEITVKSFGGYVDCLCVIEAPIKANVDVRSGNGCVSVGSFENDFLKIQTDAGNVEVDKFQSGDFEVSTGSGDVTCKKNTQAARIHLKTKSGNIKTAKLQGQSLVVETMSGIVTTQASYCDRSVFSSKSGSFYLQNVHKDCRIAIEEGGFVSLVVFDGTLRLDLKNANADLLLSRILGDSFVSIKEGGALNLKVVESCFDETTFRIEAKDFNCKKMFNYSKDGDAIVVKPKVKEENVVNVDCKNGCVNIENTTITELFRLLK